MFSEYGEPSLSSSAKSPRLPRGRAGGLSAAVWAAGRLLAQCCGNTALGARLLLPKHSVPSPCASGKPSGEAGLAEPSLMSHCLGAKIPGLQHWVWAPVVSVGHLESWGAGSLCCFSLSTAMKCVLR